MRYLPDDNLSYPVLVKIGNGTGSGFYFRTDNKLFFVTARHVLFDIVDPVEPLRHTAAQLISYDLKISDEQPIVLGVDLSKAKVRKNTDKDIAILELGDAINEAAQVKFSASVKLSNCPEGANITVVPSGHLKRFNDVLISNEVFILGYPNSLSDPEIPQIESDRPLLRKGIVAGLNKVNETIILDCPVYFGNSGGLAIEIEETGIGSKKFHVIGVVSEFVPFVERLQSIQLGYVNRNYENSGYSVAVPIDTILDLTKDRPIPKPKMK